MRRHLFLTLALAGIFFPLSMSFAARAPAAPAAAPDRPTTRALALAQRDQQALALARPDQRDLYDLTRRLKLHLTSAISPYVRTSAPNYAVGHKATFWVAQATSGFFAMHATMLAKTAHAYWYVQDKTGIPAAKLLALVRASAHDFETRVYPTDHAAFGQEIPLGPDHDPRITILCANLPGVGGYYSAEDLYPRAVNAYSNQRKMLYVDIVSFPLGTPDFNEGIAHEFQHMIHWYQHVRDDAWINEGSSMLAQVLNGYTADGYDGEFAATPGTQLDTFCYGAPNCSDGQSIADYGGSFLWLYYFYQHYGGNRALHALLADKSLDGIALFDDVLARLGTHDRARDMFRKWVIANLVDDPTLGGVYGYQPTFRGCCIHASLTASTGTYPYVRRAAVRQFATDYLELRPAGSSTLHLQFSGDPTAKIVANTPLQGGTEWWSNRSDEMDSTLTHAFDLSRVRHATLQYDIWHDTEKDFDYGYVEVSRDGGTSWHTLRGRYTTDADPNALNYGNGYTGSSLKAAGNHGGWLHENIDLSTYAGQRILIRFEHITDDTVNMSGVTLDNIRIPEIGFADHPGQAGWQTRGWVRISNLLPTHWLVQLVLYTSHGVTVQQVPVATDGTGGATISGLGSAVQRAVLVVAPTAPQTTIASRYTVEVR